jgi:hypothetical protein
VPYSRLVGKLLRRLAIALLFWFLIVFAITSALRIRFSRPTVYIGDVRSRSADALPLDVGHSGAAVRDARHHEQEIG